MKSRGKFLSVVLSLLMVLGMLPGMALTAYAGGPISEVSANISEPAAGETAMFEAELGEGEYSLDSVGWFDETREIWLLESDTFEAGHAYTLTIWLKPSGELPFDDPENITGRINGALVQVLDDPDPEHTGYIRLVMEYEPLPEEGQQIEKAQITVNAPEAGSYSFHGPYSLTVYPTEDGASYDVMPGAWFENVFAVGNFEAAFEGMFEEGRTYYGIALIVPHEGYFVSPSEIEIEIEGAELCGVMPYSMDGQMCAEVAFSAQAIVPEELDGMRLNVKTPKAGDSASVLSEDIFVTIPEDEEANYSIEQGVWWDSTENLGDFEKAFTGTFENGKMYYGAVLVTPNSGFKFTETNLKIDVTGARLYDYRRYNYGLLGKKVLIRPVDILPSGSIEVYFSVMLKGDRNTVNVSFDANGRGTAPEAIEVFEGGCLNDVVSWNMVKMDSIDG